MIITKRAGLKPITLILIVLISFTCTAFSAENNTLKVLNWNVLYGFNHNKAIAQGIRWIKGQDSDVVALQELNGINENSLKNMAKQWGHEHAVILKEEGFPVGLTSRKPIEVIERKVKGFHHGYLHAKTSGIHFFVVHFWPYKDHEAKAIIEKIKPLLKQGKKVVVTGDFNTYSEKDNDYLATRKNLRFPVSENNRALYNVVNMFEAKGFVDLIYKHDKKAKYSYPSPIIMVNNGIKTMEELKAKRKRIDFIFADETLQTFSTSATIKISKELVMISDHYPTLAEFKLPSEVR